MAAFKLDEYWSHPWMTDPDLIGRNLLRQAFKSYSRYTQSDGSTALKADIKLYEELETYRTRMAQIRVRPCMLLFRAPVSIWLRPMEQRSC